MREGARRRGPGQAGGAALRLHGFEPCSAANGPGLRAVVWVQGCTLACPGCFTPRSHGRDGDEVGVDALFERISALGDRIEGVTVTGGEPLQQRGAVLTLLHRLRAETPLTALLLTGYRWAEVVRMPEAAYLYACVDIVIAGRYEERRHIGRGLRGSSNQTVHLFGDRYTLGDLEAVPEAEVLVRPDGRLTLTGIDPPALPPADFPADGPAHATR